MKKSKIDILPYTRQFYKGNIVCFIAVLCEILLSAVGSLLVSDFDVFSAAAGKCCLYTGDEEFEARLIFPPPFAPQKPMRRTKIDRKRFLKTERLKRRKNPSRTFAFSKSLWDKRPENRRSAYFPLLSKTIYQANPTKFSKAFSLCLSAAFFMRQRRPRFPFSSGHPTSADVRNRIFESFSPFQESRKEEF